ncbi:MAG: dimethyl sulfoxide reductase anchor subunit [Syntrophomonadaceae bacterium]|nr:dimethyl sulfoxide reductase anchor subunit [Syntrophomonadaceae bacterium]
MSIEYSLAGSYLFIGTSIGLAIWYLLAQFVNQEEAKKYADKMMKVTIVLAIIGVILATLHLGRMERFIYLILNPSSWLAREGLCAGAFTGGIILYYLLIRNKNQEIPKYAALLYVVILAGVCTLISMGMIYASVSAIPAWNNTLFVLVNICSSLLLGGILFLVVTKGSLAPESYKTYIISLLAVALLSLVINITYEAHVNMVLNNLALQGAAVPSVWLGAVVRIVVGLLVPAYLIYKILSPQNNKSANYINITLACIIVGEVMAKIMHFMVGVKGPFL